jgi:cardiolipin synthase
MCTEAVVAQPGDPRAQAATLSPICESTFAAWRPEPMLNRIIEFWPLLIGIAGLAASLTVTVHAVLWKRDTRSVIGWVSLAWMAPLMGPALYICFGVNRIQRKAVSLRFRQPVSWERELTLSDDEQAVRDHLVSVHPTMVGLARLGRRITQRRLLPGNFIVPLVNGDQAFPAMIQAIDQAERTVALLSYIFDVDRAGIQFLDALIRAASRGVEVRVLIDHIGARYSRPNMIRRLRKAGVTTAAFLPTRAPKMAQYANLRNHRKLLIVDGRVGFTGGTNIREGHCLKLQPKCPVKCLHFRVEGPVVSHLREAFAIDWSFATSETLNGEDWFPPLEKVGAAWARGIHDGPDEDFEKVSDLLMGALASATSSVRIVTPYFLPHAPLITALNVTAMRGVTVDILLPSKSNLPFVGWASTAMYWQFLEKGCRIHLTNPPFDHTKLMVVDGIWSLIGSTNWDARSLRLNFEFNVECYDAALAEQLNQVIDQKLRHSRLVTLDEVHQRSLFVKLRDGLSRLLTPYL